MVIKTRFPYGTVVIDYDGETLMSLGLPDGVGPADKVTGSHDDICCYRIGFREGEGLGSYGAGDFRRPPTSLINATDETPMRYVVQEEA